MNTPNRHSIVTHEDLMVMICQNLSILERHRMYVGLNLPMPARVVRMNLGEYAELGPEGLCTNCYVRRGEYKCDWCGYKICSRCSYCTFHKNPSNYPGGPNYGLDAHVLRVVDRYCKSHRPKCSGCKIYGNSKLYIFCCSNQGCDELVCVQWDGLKIGPETCGTIRSYGEVYCGDQCLDHDLNESSDSDSDSDLDEGDHSMGSSEMAEYLANRMRNEVPDKEPSDEFPEEMNIDSDSEIYLDYE